MAPKSSYSSNNMVQSCIPHFDKLLTSHAATTNRMNMDAHARRTPEIQYTCTGI